jgi:hypothetical protein
VVKSELLKRSPLKVLEQTTHGGPGPGNLGAVVAPKGVGKTAFLVHLATYQLLQQRHVIHVSFSSKTDHIVAWYEEIFQEVARRFDLDGAMDVHDEIIRNRVIMNFNQSGPTIDGITRSLSSMIGEGHFAADLVVVDGFDFTRSRPEEVLRFRSFARERGIEIWFSASVPSHEDTTAFDAYRECFATVISMRSAGGSIRLGLEKDHDVDPLPRLDLTLDPKNLLVSE